MSTLLEAALAYGDLGLKVFPIANDSKRPITTHGWHDASSDPDVITQWWTDHPDARIGLPMRLNGMLAIDVDVAEGKSGDETLARLENAYGALPRTNHQRSGRGGEHFVVRDPAPGDDGWTRQQKLGGACRANLDSAGCGGGVDVRASHYIVVEPSGSYRWIAFDLAHLEDLPPAWVALIRKPVEAGAAPDSEGLEAWASDSDPMPLLPADRERLRADLRALGPRGRGGSSTFSAVLRVHHDYGLSLENGWEYLSAWNASCGLPRSADELHRQIRNIAESGRAGGQRGNRRSDLSQMQRIVRAAFDHRSVELAAPPSNAATLGPETDDDAEPTPIPVLPPACAPAGPDEEIDYLHADPAFNLELNRAATAFAARLATDGTTVAALVPLFESARVLLARKFPVAPYLIDGLLTRGGVSGTSGEPKSSKTWAALEKVLAVVTGTAAFGKFTIAKPGRAAYFFAEDIGVSVQTRINALTAGRPNMAAGWQDRLLLQPRGRAIDITRDIDCVLIIASVRLWGPIDLLVLDPLRDIHSGEEDSSDAMSLVTKRLAAIGDILDCAVEFVHHAGKASADNTKRRAGQRMRGSGALHGSLDCGFHMWDLRGNETTEFQTAVTSEIKNARSAGTFDLKLDIVDNKHGTAERASWTISERAKEEPKGAKKQPELGDVLMALFDFGGAAMSESSLGRKVGGHVGAVVAAAARDGFVQHVMAGTTAIGVALTEKGRRVVQQGSAGLTLVEAPAAPHPATAAICNLPPEKP